MDVNKNSEVQYESYYYQSKIKVFPGERKGVESYYNSVIQFRMNN